MSGVSAYDRLRTSMLMVVAGGGAAGLGAFAWWANNHRHVGLVIVMAVLTPVPFVVRSLQGRWDPLEPINLIVVGLLVLFVWRPIYELAQHPNPYPGYDAQAGFDGAMSIGIVGTALLYLGYFTGAGRKVANRFRPLADEWDAARSVLFVRRLLYVCAVLTLLYVAAVGPHAVISKFTGRAVGYANLSAQSSGYIVQGPYLLIPASFILVIAFAKRRTWGTGALLVACAGTALAITVIPGDRTFVLELVLPLVALWYLRHHRRPRVWAILAAFVLFLMFANIELFFRDTTNRSGHSVPAAVASAVTHPGRELTKFITGADPAEFSVLEIEWKAYQGRVLAFQPGSTLRGIVIGWVPHQVFGNKKPMTPLQYVTWTLFPSTLNKASFGPGVYGAMFADYGWLALIVLSFLVGLALRAFWEYFLRAANSGGMQLVFAGILPMVIIMLRDDIDDIFYRSVFIVLPLILCVRICSRPPKRRRRSFALGRRNEPAGAVGELGPSTT